MEGTAKTEGKYDVQENRFGTRLGSPATEAIWRLFECLSLGVLLVRRNGTVAFSNQRARELMKDFRAQVIDHRR